jgi:hypothetical protein
MKIEVGQAYKDGNGKVVAMVAQHPWFPNILIGALPDGSVRKYRVDTGEPEFPYGDGTIRGHAAKPRVTKRK